MDEDNANVWLEAAKDSFDENLDAGNYVACQDIIKDLRHNGFGTEANELTQELGETKISDLAIEIPITKLV